MIEINKNQAITLYGSDSFFQGKERLSLEEVLKSGYKGILKNQFPRKRKVKSLLFFNVKGGVGKTTLSFQMARFLALHGFKVCVLGIDSSASISKSFFPKIDLRKISAKHCLSTILEQVFLKNPFAAHSTNLGCLDIIIEREDIETEFRTIFDKRGRPDGYRPSAIFKEILIPALSKKYDFVIMDSPPRIDEGLLPRNALKSADRVIVPIDSGVNAFEDFVDRYHLIQYAVGENSSKKIKIVFNNFEDWAFCREIDGFLREQLAEQIIDPGIKKSASINNARYDRLAVFEKFPKASISAQMVLLLTNIFNDVMESKNDNKRKEKITH